MTEQCSSTLSHRTDIFMCSCACFFHLLAPLLLYCPVHESAFAHLRPLGALTRLRVGRQPLAFDKDLARPATRSPDIVISSRSTTASANCSAPSCER